jgi:hypothetical protein
MGLMRAGDMGLRIADLISPPENRRMTDLMRSVMGEVDSQIWDCGFEIVGAAFPRVIARSLIDLMRSIRRGNLDAGATATLLAGGKGEITSSARRSHEIA